MENGATIVGFADLNDLSEEIRFGLPFGISIGVNLEPEIISKIKSGPTQEYIEEYNRANQLLDSLSAMCAEYLKDSGYDGKALSELYTEIMDTLGIQRACFIGASQGGFISTNMALYASERVEKIILCGPMGYTGTNISVLRILITAMFPVKPIQNSA